MLKPIVITALIIGSSSCATRIPAYDFSQLRSGGTFDRQGGFKIGAGDEVNVLVYGEDRISGTYTVSQAGFLSIPLLNPIQVIDQTATSLSYTITRALKRLIKDPKVSVSLTGVRSFQVYFAGEVEQVGAVNLTNKTNFLQAITLAGGLSDFASGRIVLIRKTGKNQTKRYATDFDDILLGKNFIDQLTLEAGDIIIAE